MKILLIVYNQGNFIATFPHGLAYIAAILKKNKHKVTIYNQDVHHYPEAHLTHYLDHHKFDILGISVIGGYYQYAKLLSISKAINNSKNRPFYVIGGHCVSPEPEYFLHKTQADAICIGEGEQTVLELVNALINKTSLEDIAGLAYRLDDKIVVNTKQRELIKDIDTIPLPAWELFPIYYYRLLRYVNMDNDDFIMPVLSGRGCIYNCNFCMRLDKGFRPRSNKAIIHEIKILQSRYRINTIDFSDELLLTSAQRTISLCEALIKANLKIKWHCNGRLNFASEEVLKVMKEAGCIFINYGIEALDDEVLKNMHKALTVEQIIRGVENTIKIGISPGLNIIWGNLGDTKETLKKGVDFLLKYDDCAQLRTIRPVTPYPGSELYYDAIKMGKLNDVEDFYEVKHKNSDLLAVNFTDLSDDEFHKCLLEANTALITNYYQKKLYSVINEAKNLYLYQNTNFRGFRTF